MKSKQNIQIWVRESEFASALKKRLWKSRFLSKYADAEIASVDLSGDDWESRIDRVFEVLSSGGFFASRRLVFLDIGSNVFSKEIQKKIADACASASEDTVAVFIVDSKKNVIPKIHIESVGIDAPVDTLKRIMRDHSVRTDRRTANDLIRKTNEAKKKKADEIWWHIQTVCEMHAGADRMLKIEDFDIPESETESNAFFGVVKKALNNPTGFAHSCGPIIKTKSDLESFIPVLNWQLRVWAMAISASESGDADFVPTSVKPFVWNAAKRETKGKTMADIRKLYRSVAGVSIALRLYPNTAMARWNMFLRNAGKLA